MADPERYRTASPEKGAVKERDELASVVPPAIMAPVAGLSHSTYTLPTMDERFTVTVPPDGR